MREIYILGVIVVLTVIQFTDQSETSTKMRYLKVLKNLGFGMTIAFSLISSIALIIQIAGCV